MVTRESEWDEQQRRRAEGLTYYEDFTCAGCGGDLHRTLTYEGPYDVDDKTVCYSCRALATGQRWDEHLHKDEKPGPADFHHSDGRKYTVREMGPEEA